MRTRRRPKEEAELDITSFMNLMIILVPVLLMSMVFSHITVLDLKLPDIASDPSTPPKDNEENDSLELVIELNEMVINYPAGAPLKRLPKIEDPETGERVYDFKTLSIALQEVKRLLKSKGKDKKDILIMSQPNTDYQTIVQAMDTVRSFKAVVAATVVNAELFPAVSLGDAPVSEASDRPGGKR
ncbi:ExbD/TolR family protein [Teredinibacter franksiae]|uniref:ExbD/TolR family protein n=1 Tax=Teredinibacter franksiae TaxID=2761453 RepID=UPI0016275017|nr:biopolymer transporter ExbD [Teredinibacter franksiae]